MLYSQTLLCFPSHWNMKQQLRKITVVSCCGLSFKSRFVNHMWPSQSVVCLQCTPIIYGFHWTWENTYETQIYFFKWAWKEKQFTRQSQRKGRYLSLLLNSLLNHSLRSWQVSWERSSRISLLETSEMATCCVYVEHITSQTFEERAILIYRKRYTKISFHPV